MDILNNKQLPDGCQHLMDIMKKKQHPQQQQPQPKLQQPQQQQQPRPHLNGP